MPYEGQTGTAPDGTRVIFRGGKVYPIDQDPQKMSPKATEDQAKANTYARLMRDAELSYDRAVNQGYNPGGIRNTTASFFEGLPLGGLDGVGAMIRDDVSDRARQAELQWSDAQLKAVSGAASPEAEVKRNVRTFFPRPGENMADINPQKTRARTTAFESAQMRAGPYSSTIGRYPQMLGKGAQGSAPDNAFDLSQGQSRTTIPAGAYYRDPQGNIRQNMNDDNGNPIVMKARDVGNTVLKAKSATAKANGGWSKSTVVSK